MDDRPSRYRGLIGARPAQKSPGSGKQDRANNRNQHQKRVGFRYHGGGSLTLPPESLTLLPTISPFPVPSVICPDCLRARTMPFTVERAIWTLPEPSTLKRTSSAVSPPVRII